MSNMKKFGCYLILLALVSFFTGCVKNEEPVFTAPVVEMDAAAWNANSVGVTYPILTRMPAAGRASSSANTADSIITRRSGSVQLRVNLVGAQRNTATDVTYTVDQTASTAVAGTHYAPLSGTVTIPANSSFGYINIQILN